MYGKDLASWNIGPLKNRAKQQKGLFVEQMNTADTIWRKKIWVEHMTLWEVECLLHRKTCDFFHNLKDPGRL